MGTYVILGLFYGLLLCLALKIWHTCSMFTKKAAVCAVPWDVRNGTLSESKRQGSGTLICVNASIELLQTLLHCPTLVPTVLYI